MKKTSGSKTGHRVVEGTPPDGDGPASRSRRKSRAKSPKAPDSLAHPGNEKPSPATLNPTTSAKAKPDQLDPVWKALSDPTRRAILDLLRDKPRTTTEIVETFPHLTRFGVMKHLDALRDAGLVNTREDGRQRWNSLNIFPIRQIYERWVSPFQEMWGSQLLGIKELAEEGPAPTPQTPRKRTRS